MPYINTKASCKISPEQEIVLKTKIGEAISVIPGKTERWLMVSFEDNYRLWFGGTNEPCAMVEVSLFGASSPEAYNNFTMNLTEIISNALNIEANRIYVDFSEYNNWGWNGKNF